MAAAKNLSYAVKMKLFVLLLILTFLIMPSANAVTTNELKIVLKEVLKLYFENPQNSRLSVPELRDLLISFFETPTGQEVNLNKIGKHSGKFLLEIYDKAKVKEWTILVFMNGDNNLEGFGIQNINDMEKTGSSKDVNVIVEFDRSPDWDDSNGNWSATKIFYITQDNNLEKISSREIEDLGEVDMASSVSLEDFIMYTMENYPAKHYALILWNHGGGWLGFSNDDTDYPMGLSVSGLAVALKNIVDEKKIKFDIIGFDMCLMSMLEVYAQIADFANVAIASEELEPGTGWNYEGMLKFITENPTSNARTFASQITKSYYDFYEGKDSAITLSAIDLSKINGLIASISAISPKINSDMELAWKEIARANNRVERYATTAGRSYIDIFNLFDLLVPTAPGTDLSNDLTAAQKAVSEAVIDNVKGSAHYFSTGISIYFPRSPEDYYEYYDWENSYFTNSTGWSEMIKKYYAVREESDKEPPAVLIESYEANPDFIEFAVNIKGNDILTLFFVVTQEENNISIYLYDTPLNLDFSGFEEGNIPFFWDYSIPFIFNGENFTFASLEPIDREAKKFRAGGLYTIASTNQTFNATLLFDYGILKEVYIDISYGDRVIPSPVEISPDDVFVSYQRAYDTQTSEFFNVEGTPIKIGNSGLFIEYLKFADQSDKELFLDFVAEDLSGNFAGGGMFFKNEK